MILTRTPEFQPAPLPRPLVPERAVLEAGERERRRLGGVLHDTVCQSINGVNLLVRLMHRRVLKSGAAPAPELEELVSMLGHTLTELQEVVRSLAPGDAPAGGLKAALEEKALGLAEKIECRLHCPDALPEVNTYATRQLLQIAEEAVDNALRHAGATRLEFRLTAADDEIVLAISDDGCGFEPPLLRGEKMTGLELLQYRAAVIGGTLEVKSQPGAGTTVSCRLPSPSI